jgi:xanthine dehydrogenase YagS FAD-binding subunit
MNRFDLIQPRSLAEALAALPQRWSDARFQDALPLAGGQDLLTELKEHLVEPSALVSLRGVPGLAGLEWTAEGDLVLGAMASLMSLERDERVARELPVLHQAAASVASPQIRSMATVGGNLCQRPRCWYYRNEHADCLKKGGSECLAFEGLNKYNAILGAGPSWIVHPSDLAPALVALGALVTLQGPAGVRTMPLEQFFVLPADGDVRRENVLAPGELLTSVRVPKPRAGMRSIYLKARERGSFDFALSAVALCLWHDGATVEGARLVLGGVAPTPWRCARGERLLAGQPMERGVWDRVAADCARDAEPLEHNGYKVPLTRGLVLKALRALA